MSLEIGVFIVWAVMGLGLIAYVVTAGADFGGGLWDLLAAGPRRDAQREAVHKAIAPIWEANHVWIIFLVVMMFTFFPHAFYAISVALHIPIVVALVGVVLRGSAFVFRAYGLRPAPERARWGQVFAWSSAATPVALGATLGALSTGDIRVANGAVQTGFLAGWLSPFALATGLFALSLFALLAAVYLTADTEGPLRDDFRRRALISEAVAAAFAALVAWRASEDAPALWHNLAHSPWTWPVQIATAAAAIGVVLALLKDRPALARLLIAAQVALVVLGWGLAMDGHLVLPDLHVLNAGARVEIFGPVLPALALGMALLAPALVYLYRVFKRARPTPADAAQRTAPTHSPEP